MIGFKQWIDGLNRGEGGYARLDRDLIISIAQALLLPFIALVVIILV